MNNSEKKYSLDGISAEEQKKQLLIDETSMALTIDPAQQSAANEFCEEYKIFLDNAKTEREVTEYTVELAKKHGYTEFDRTKKYRPGDKVYLVNRGRAIILTTIGTASLAEGVHISAAHIDSPRLDIKPRPLYEDEDMALLKTHYYGGIKKYQWPAMPLSLHGVVYKKNGERVSVIIGENDSDPVFTVTDLLPHLASDQMSKVATKIVTGEQLNILMGTLPVDDDKISDKVKLAVAKLLYERYGICEADLMSAELVAVPAFKARDVGLDRSLIGAYGQDDRVCAYACVMAEIEAKAPHFTTVTILADKEEVGSDGVTGLASMFFIDFIEDLCDMEGGLKLRHVLEKSRCLSSDVNVAIGSDGVTGLASMFFIDFIEDLCDMEGGLKLRHVLEKSRCLSSDVNVAIDPSWTGVNDKYNSARLNRGAVLTKYTGSRGKVETNDTTAENMSYFRTVMDEAGVVWQIGELGKVDQGGGGTVAKYVAQHNIDTVDLGVPVLSMHSPFEIAAKLDIFMTYRAVKAFYDAKK